MGTRGWEPGGGDQGVGTRGVGTRGWGPGGGDQGVGTTSSRTVEVVVRWLAYQLLVIDPLGFRRSAVYKILVNIT